MTDIQLKNPDTAQIIADEQYLRAECLRVASTIKHDNITDLLSDAGKALEWVNKNKILISTDMLFEIAKEQ